MIDINADSGHWYACVLDAVYCLVWGSEDLRRRRRSCGNEVYKRLEETEREREYSNALGISIIGTAMLIEEARITTKIEERERLEIATRNNRGV